MRLSATVRARSILSCLREFSNVVGSSYLVPVQGMGYAYFTRSKIWQSLSFQRLAQLFTRLEWPVGFGPTFGCSFEILFPRK